MHGAKAKDKGEEKEKSQMCHWCMDGFVDKEKS
jgi:hypothetical protein